MLRWGRDGMGKGWDGMGWDGMGSFNNRWVWSEHSKRSFKLPRCPVEAYYQKVFFLPLIFFLNSGVAPFRRCRKRRCACIARVPDHNVFQCELNHVG